jgi:hypothetical protein
MDREIAVICASPPGFNPGMDSVDRALVYLGQKHGFGGRLRFYRLYAAAHAGGGGEETGIPYAILPATPDFFHAQGLVLYWGDFLHMRQYHETVARRLVREAACGDLAAAARRVRQVFLQAEEDPGTLARSLTFGGTLLFNTLWDEADPTYGAALERFLRSCRGAWFRDVYSAFKACLMRGSAEPGCLGVDCANLVDADRAYPAAARPAREDRIGIFLGRSQANIEEMVGFGSELAAALGCRASWMSWGDRHAFPALPAILERPAVRNLDGFTEEPARSSADSIPELFRYRALVTDTYHICVNAWNLGVPTVCLAARELSHGRSVNSGDGFAPRDKREVFMSMYDALDFLVPGGELADRETRQRRVSHLVSLIAGGEAAAAVKSRIRRHATVAEASFMRSLAGLL